MIIDGVEFARLAQNGKRLLKELTGVSLFHNKFGEGGIILIQERTGYMPLITVRFFLDPVENEFNLTAFQEGYFPRIEIGDLLLDKLRKCHHEPAGAGAQGAGEDPCKPGLGLEFFTFEESQKDSPKSRRRITHCWACGTNGLDSNVDRICPKCGGIICPSCGACLC